MLTALYVDFASTRIHSVVCIRNTHSRDSEECKKGREGEGWDGRGGNSQCYGLAHLPRITQQSFGLIPIHTYMSGFIELCTLHRID